MCIWRNSYRSILIKPWYSKCCFHQHQRHMPKYARIQTTVLYTQILLAIVNRCTCFSAPYIFSPKHSYQSMYELNKRSSHYICTALIQYHDTIFAVTVSLDTDIRYECNVNECLSFYTLFSVCTPPNKKHVTPPYIHTHSLTSHIHIYTYTHSHTHTRAQVRT
jgi:hypothetical protein